MQRKVIPNLFGKGRLRNSINPHPLSYLSRGGRMVRVCVTTARRRRPRVMREIVYFFY